MDQTVHLMVIVYVVSQLSLSVTNITAALLGGSAALEFWHDGEMMKKKLGFKPLASCKCFFHNTARWAAQLEVDK